MGTEIPSRSPRSKYAKSYLFQNDIYFFIEDTDKNTVKIMLELIQRAISKDVSIDRLFPIGGRDAVVDKFNTRNSLRKEVYIIDGDLYLLFNQNAFKKGLLELKKYCIENYLLDEDAICEVLYEECTRYTDFKKMKKDFSFMPWLKTQDSYLKKIFLEYAIEKKNNLGIQTVKYKVGQLQKSNGTNVTCELDKQRVALRVETIRKEIIQRLGRRSYAIDKKLIKHNLYRDNFASLRFASAKDYIFPLLFKRIQKIVERDVNYSAFQFRLAKKCNLDEFEQLLAVHI